MFKRLVNFPSRRRSFAVPAGQRVYAVGDIHGRLDLLDELLGMIQLDSDGRGGGAETTLIFLGDLVDRGPNSRGVIDRLLSVSRQLPNSRFLLGNHDEVFLKAARGDEKALRFLTRIGGKETILSYGMSEDEYLTAGYDELTAFLVSAVPEEHIRFLSKFEDYACVGGYLFVHAGLRPGVDITQQNGADLRWIRGDFLNFRKLHSHLVVHGHTISSEADVRSNRIGIDTGAFASGRLTAIGLEGPERWFVSAQGEPDARWGNLSD